MIGLDIVAYGQISNSCGWKKLEKRQNFLFPLHKLFVTHLGNVVTRKFVRELHEYKFTAMKHQYAWPESRSVD
jgi:hypothetical protein